MKKYTITIFTLSNKVFTEFCIKANDYNDAVKIGGEICFEMRKNNTDISSAIAIDFV